MKRMVLAAAMTLALSGVAQALEVASATETARFYDLEGKLWAAWNARLRPADAAPFYSQSPDNLYFNLTPLKFTGWAEFEKVMTPALAGGAAAKMLIGDDFRVLREGRTAIVAYTFRTEFSGANAPQSFTGRMTDVWTNERGSWRLVHQHMSSPLVAP